MTLESTLAIIHLMLNRFEQEKSQPQEIAISSDDLKRLNPNGFSGIAETIVMLTKLNRPDLYWSKKSLLEYMCIEHEGDVAYRNAVEVTIDRFENDGLICPNNRGFLSPAMRLSDR